MIYDLYSKLCILGPIHQKIKPNGDKMIIRTFRLNGDVKSTQKRQLGIIMTIETIVFHFQIMVYFFIAISHAKPTAEDRVKRDVTCKPSPPGVVSIDNCYANRSISCTFFSASKVCC